MKSTGTQTYAVYEVMGWMQRRNLPEILAGKRGEGVDALIEKIDQAAHSYPYAKNYTMWPGPNSNTFTAWVSRAVPELGLDLPPTAIGKDYLGIRLILRAPSGSGFQFSFFGLAGVLASEIGGVEFNFLGLSFGIDSNPLALRLPLVGRKELASWRVTPPMVFATSN